MPCLSWLSVVICDAIVLMRKVTIGVCSTQATFASELQTHAFVSHSFLTLATTKTWSPRSAKPVVGIDQENAHRGWTYDEFYDHSFVIIGRGSEAWLLDSVPAQQRKEIGEIVEGAGVRILCVYYYYYFIFTHPSAGTITVSDGAHFSTMTGLLHVFKCQRSENKNESTNLFNVVEAVRHFSKIFFARIRTQQSNRKCETPPSRIKFKDSTLCGK